MYLLMTIDKLVNINNKKLYLIRRNQPCINSKFMSIKYTEH